MMVTRARPPLADLDPATSGHADEHDRVVTTAPHRVARPVMLQEWRDVAFVHWRVEPSRVERLLPTGLHIDTFDGSAWVGLIAFEMVGIRPPGLPRIPHLGSFPETNVRTYVRDSSGRPGVWFHSLEASRLLPVAAARVGYSLPYMWADMSIHRTVDTIRYATRRRWPGPRDVGGVVTIGVEPGSAPLPPDPLDAFLTARWGLYSTSANGRLRYAPVEHPPWILHGASVLHLSDGLVAAAGYEDPDDLPHVRWSPGVPVRIGVPKTVR